MKNVILIFLFLIASPNVMSSTFGRDLVNAAFERTQHDITYDGSYHAIKYPSGDVPANIGVCTDVVIRSYRAIGVDLQRLVHEDIAKNFDKYPSKRIWNLNKPDKNIDHRRVPNLRVFFSRYGDSLPVMNKGEAYKAGDLVTWVLFGNLPHIGIVTDKVSATSGLPMIVHNIGAGPKLEDMLFDYEITGHYRYVPEKYKK